MSTKLLAIDSSTNKSGIALFIDGKYQTHRLLDCSKDKVMDSRFKKMSMELWKTLELYVPDIVYIEETVVVRNAQTQRFLTRLQGVIFAWCMNHDCEFNTIRPSEWRAAINISQGKNIKRKQLKQQAIQRVTNCYGFIVGDDEADAICIGDAVVKIFQGKNTEDLL